MDLATILGIIIAFGSLLGGNILEGGHISSLIQPTAFLIVGGGTLGAVFVSFPMRDLVNALKNAKSLFFHGDPDLQKIIQDLASYSDMARRNGLLALQPLINESAGDPFKTKALQLVVDGADPQQFKDFMEIELMAFEASGKGVAEVFEAGGGFSPTVGIIGAVFGLIHVMGNLNDPSKLGPGIAVAFVATIYGLVIANIFCLPAATKLKKNLKRKVLAKTLIIEGLLDIQSGMNPRLIVMKLEGFIAAEGGGKSKGEEAAK
ncbi:MAG: chemotaxis protein [Desulfobulbaceae bacterium]|jgi:chemotaxis protein MotA|nr:MAG: chemotaxis protein [Desulfobulbaceae bacterium]